MPPAAEYHLMQVNPASNTNLPQPLAMPGGQNTQIAGQAYAPSAREEGVKSKQSSGKPCRENAKLRPQFEIWAGRTMQLPISRHCERSETIQNLSAATIWIVSLRSQ
jgi:hypothetical protein